MSTKQRETLEQMAKREAGRICFDAQSPTGTSLRGFTADGLAEQLAGFARKVLEEARPYMEHGELCRAILFSPVNEDRCDCGLAELLEGWK